jgi:hypothetical protein
MTKTELESKHLAELHELAADAGVERYRMLPRAELIEKLSGGDAGTGAKPKRERRPRERKPRQPRAEQSESQRTEPEPAAEEKPKPTPSIAPATTQPPSTSDRPKRKRRRRWGRRPKGVRVRDLLLPAGGSRQTIVYAESRADCTTLLREVAAELSGASSGPDPIALLVDPSPEELAEWKRDAPEAEIVSAGKAKHADDALARASTRAGAGEDVIVLIDSLSRYAEDFAGPDETRALFDAGVTAAGSGSLTVVAAVEKP